MKADKELTDDERNYLLAQAIDEERGDYTPEQREELQRDYNEWLVNREAPQRRIADLETQLAAAENLRTKFESDLLAMQHQRDARRATLQAVMQTLVPILASAPPAVRTAIDIMATAGITYVHGKTRGKA